MDMVKDKRTVIVRGLNAPTWVIQSELETCRHFVLPGFKPCIKKTKQNKKKTKI